LIDEAEDDQDRCRHLNVTLPTLLAEFCADSGARLLSFSSDQIFDGFGTSPYRETDRTSPLSFYGRSKLESENAILACYHPALIIRSGPTFGPWDENNFLTRALRSAGRGRRFFAANDLIASPTYLPDLVDTALDLLIDDASGIWHLANPGAIDWASFGRMGAELLGIDSQYIIGRSHEAFDLSAARPRYSALSSIKASLLPDLERSVDTYIRECRVALR
ncbi:MAG: NAD-dependent epimerase/dehydratase family protein, partial [Proteobacteria bacterium]